MAIASASELKAALEAGGVVVDIRGAAERVPGKTVKGAVHAEWDRDACVMPTDSLPADKTTTLLVH